jgi:hypothetical protein
MGRGPYEADPEAYQGQLCGSRICRQHTLLEDGGFWLAVRRCSGVSVIRAQQVAHHLEDGDGVLPHHHQA